MVSPITTHILDTARGCPAAGVPISLHLLNKESGAFESVGAGETNVDGRCPALLEPGQLQVGTYKIVFDTETYFKSIEVRPCSNEARTAAGSPRGATAHAFSFSLSIVSGRVFWFLIRCLHPLLA